MEKHKKTDPYSYSQLPRTHAKCCGQVRHYALPSKQLLTGSAQDLYDFLLEGNLADRTASLIDFSLCAHWPISQLLYSFFKLRDIEPSTSKACLDACFDFLDGHLCDMLQRCATALWMHQYEHQNKV